METQGSLSSRRSQILNTPSSENWCRTKVKVFLLEMIQCIKQLPGTYEIR